MPSLLSCKKKREESIELVFYWYTDTWHASFKTNKWQRPASDDIPILSQIHSSCLASHLCIIYVSFLRKKIWSCYTKSFGSSLATSWAAHYLQNLSSLFVIKLLIAVLHPKYQTYSLFMSLIELQDHHQIKKISVNPKLIINFMENVRFHLLVLVYGTISL